MKNNTVVIACDQNYFWGVFLMAASMRMNGMDEPVLVAQSGFTPEMKECILQFGDIRVVDVPVFTRSLCCRKAAVMLMADTEYVTWADCDGMFVGNCSELLIPTSPDRIHVRARTIPDNHAVFVNGGLYKQGDRYGMVPAGVLDVWRRDVGGLAEPRLQTCVTACFISVHRSLRPFLERWQDQMDRVLPNRDVGLVDPSTRAYYQLDESVLNSLLFFLKGAPLPCEFRLDKDPRAFYVHWASIPKPWQAWSAATLRSHGQVMELMQWAGDHGLLRIPPPFMLNPRYARLHRHLTFMRLIQRIRRRINRFINSRKK